MLSLAFTLASWLSSHDTLKLLSLMIALLVQRACDSGV
jgi:hypothetical protein